MLCLLWLPPRTPHPVRCIHLFSKPDPDFATLCFICKPDEGDEEGAYLCRLLPQPPSDDLDDADDLDDEQRSESAPHFPGRLVVGACFHELKARALAASAAAIGTSSENVANATTGVGGVGGEDGGGGGGALRAAGFQQKYGGNVQVSVDRAGAALGDLVECDIDSDADSEDRHRKDCGSTSANNGVGGGRCGGTYCDYHTAGANKIKNAIENERTSAAGAPQKQKQQQYKQKKWLHQSTQSSGAPSGCQDDVRPLATWVLPLVSRPEGFLVEVEGVVLRAEQGKALGRRLDSLVTQVKGLETALSCVPGRRVVVAFCL